MLKQVFTNFEVVFPALAGVILTTRPVEMLGRGFSRTCGGDFYLIHFLLLNIGFSRTCGGDPIVLTIQENGFEFFPHMRG